MFLTKMGLPLDQCKEDYNNMSPRYKEVLKSKFDGKFVCLYIYIYIYIYICVCMYVCMFVNAIGHYTKAFDILVLLLCDY